MVFNSDRFEWKWLVVSASGMNYTTLSNPERRTFLSILKLPASLQDSLSCKPLLQVAETTRLNDKILSGLQKIMRNTVLNEDQLVPGHGLWIGGSV